jgi:hypothetical protein
MLAKTLAAVLALQAPAPDLRWSEEDVQKRIRDVFPPDVRGKVEVFRSKYYIVLTDSSVGRKFADILDTQVYEGFRALFPFKEQDDPRLMAVYLFKTKEGYWSFCERGPRWNRKKAEESAGHAWKDYYATSYDSPRAPIHFHEGAHQIMANRLRLGGGGSWFQEGIAEYYEDRISMMNRSAEIRSAIRAGGVLPLQKLFTSESLLFTGGDDVKGFGGSRGRYGQAASVIQFLKEGTLADRFGGFLVKMGRLPHADLPEIEKVFQSVYKLSVAQIEEKWKEHFLK